MTALFIAVGTVVFLSLILLLWIKVKIKFKDDLDIGIYIGPFKIKPDFSEKNKKKKKKSTEKVSEPEKTKSKKAKDIIRTVSDLIGIIKDFLIKNQRSIHFYTPKFYVRIGAEDAALTALECAGAKAAASMLFSFIDSVTSIDEKCEKNVNIIPDFTTEIFECDVEIIFKTRLANLLRALVAIFFGFIKKSVKREILQSEKGQQK